MSKTFEVRYTLGSLLDKYDSVMTNNGSVTMSGTPKGYAIKLNGSSQWISYAGTRNVKSIVVWLKAKALSKDIIDFDGGTHSIEVGVTNVTATGFVSPSIYIDTISSAALPLNKIVCLVITTATSFSSTALKIGKETSYFNGDVLCVKLFDNTLSFNDVQKEQEEFNNARMLSKQKRGAVLNKVNDLSRFKGTGINQGMVAAYSMTNRGGVVTDISGNLKNGTATNCINTKDGLALYGINSKISYGNIGNVKSVSFRIKPTSITCKILEGRTNAALVHINSGTLTAPDFANIYIDGIAGTTMAANKWQTITLTSAVDVTFSAFTLGLNNTTYGAFEVADLRVWNRQISLTEAKQYHNSFVQPLYLNDFSSDAFGNTPKDFITVSGTTNIGELSVKSGSLDKRTKYLSFTTSGSVKVAVDLNPFPAYIKYWYWNGSTWTQRSGLVSAPVTGVAYAGGYLTFTGTTNGDRITGIEVYLGTKQL